MRLLHPFMPFLSEEIWQRLPLTSADPKPASIVIAKFPTASSAPGPEEADFDSKMKVSGHTLQPCASLCQQQLQSVVHAARSLRDSFGVEGPAPFVVFAPRGQAGTDPR